MILHVKINIKSHFIFLKVILLVSESAYPCRSNIFLPSIFVDESIDLKLRLLDISI